MAGPAFVLGRQHRQRLRDEPAAPEPPPEPPGDPGAAARSFYESLVGPVGSAEPPASPARFCPTCGCAFRDPPGRHRRSTGHLLALRPPEPPPVPPEPPPVPGSGLGYRLLLRAGWSGGGLGPAGTGRLLPVPTELKRDRAGLGWGRRSRARVTHFGPGDAAVVTGAAPGGAGGGGEGARGRGRRRGRSEEAERAWEIRLREYMERWDPPEPPPGARRRPRRPPGPPPARPEPAGDPGRPPETPGAAPGPP